MSYSIGFDAADQCDRIADEMARDEAWIEHLEDLMGCYLFETPEGFDLLMEHISVNDSFIERMNQSMFSFLSKTIVDETDRSKYAMEVQHITEDAARDMIKNYWDDLYKALERNKWLDVQLVLIASTTRVTGATITIHQLVLLLSVTNLRERGITTMIMTTDEFKDWVAGWQDKISAAWRLGLEEESQWMEQQFMKERGEIHVVHEDNKEDEA